MRKLFLLLFIVALVPEVYCQRLLTAEELTRNESTWLHLKSRITSAKNAVEILPANVEDARRTIVDIQLTTRSELGAIIYNTGGLLIDYGWIRILASGDKKLSRTISRWNTGKAYTAIGERPYFLFVADDAVGGLFSVNYGAFGTDTFRMYYLSPDDLKNEPLDITYNQFLEMCFNGNLEQFYSGLRWHGWQEDLKKLKGDMVFHFNPPLWSKEGKNIDSNLRSPVPIQEQYEFNETIIKQIKDRK